MTSAYSHEERYKIIRYILDNEIVSGLKGNAVWKDIERAKIINRSWQSMRTQFKGKIIDMLHLFDLTDDERRRILHGFGTKLKPLTNNFQRTVVGKRNRLSFSSDSDSDTTIHLVEENNPLNKRSKLDSEGSNSPDLLCSVKRNVTENSTCNGSKRVKYNSLDQDTGTCTANTKKCSNENLRLEIQPSVIEINDSDEEQMNRRCNNEFINDINSTRIKAFSLEEDTELILFFKSHEQYLNDIHDKFVYKVFQNKTSTTRSSDELQDRFVNHILPNLFTYKCLTYDEMIKYYDCADMEVPEQLQLRISEVLAERARNKQAVLTHNRSTSTDKITVDVATQVTEPINENGQFKIYKAGKYVGITINNVQHIFVPDIDEDHGEEEKEIQDQFIIADENIHFVHMKLYTMLNSASNIEAELKSCIDEYLKKGEFNLLNMVPILDKMKLVATNLNSFDLDETVCSVQSEVEITSKHLSEIDYNSKHNVDDSMNNCKVSRTSNSVDSIVPSTQESITCNLENSPINSVTMSANTVIEVGRNEIPPTETVNKVDLMNESHERELTFDFFQNQVDEIHASTQWQNSACQLESSLNTSTQDGDVEEEISKELSVESSIEFCCSKQFDKSVDSKQLSSQSDGNVSSGSERVTLPVQPELALSLTNDTFYSAHSENVNTQN